MARGKMTATAVIPARLQSSRFPNKLLADLGGKPVLQHVWERTCDAQKLDVVIIATDSDDIASAAKSWGATTVMTSPDCQNGTERIASIVDQIESDLIINVQGDEPFIEPPLLDSIIDRLLETDADIVTPVFRIRKHEDLIDPNLVKVAIASNGTALYFSRNVIPHMRDIPKASEESEYWGHVGVYGMRKNILQEYSSLTPGKLEASEKLEQLRFLENGKSIQTIVTTYRSIGIDTENDLEKARELIG